jgi:hypothetical protein
MKYNILQFLANHKEKDSLSVIQKEFKKVKSNQLDLLKNEKKEIEKRIKKGEEDEDKFEIDME